MTVKESLDRANPNTLPDGLRACAIGSLLSADVKQTRRNLNPDVAGGNASNLATLDVIDLPNDAKASMMVTAYSRAGGVTGPLTPVAVGATPLTGQIAITANGDIALLATDAITDLDVEYFGLQGEVFEVDAQVVADSLALPSSLITRGVIALLEVSGSAGTAGGTKIVLLPGAGAPAAGQGRLDVAKAAVTFAAADGLTSATIKVLVAPRTQHTSVLEGDTPVLL